MAADSDTLYGFTCRVHAVHYNERLVASTIGLAYKEYNGRSTLGLAVYKSIICHAW